MDIEEILTYKPVKDVLEIVKENDNENKEKGQKRKVEEILNQNKAVNLNFNVLDETSIRRLIFQFERKLIKNQQLRIKFANEPTKFLDSEMELFDSIQEMYALSTQPEFYPLLIENKVISNLLGLLFHENSDILVSVINLIQELSDLDEVENAENFYLILDSLIEGQIINQLISNLNKLDDENKEESSAIYNALAIIENLLDYKPEINKDCDSLIIWILQNLNSKLFSANKLYSIEILSILFQNNEKNRKFLGTQNGIDILLKQIANYKKHEPTSLDEQEYIENLFDCLCSSLLMCNENRKLFYKGEGIELMNIILRDKYKKKNLTSMRTGALKTLNYVLINDSDDEDFLIKCSKRFIDILGLKGLFPIFMVPKSIVSTKKKSELIENIEKIEEHTLLVILILLKYSKKQNKSRIVYKFFEKNYEKTERLIELYFKYADKVIKCDQKINKEKAKLHINDEKINEDDFLSHRLTNGFFSLQLICQIIIILSSQDIQKSVSFISQQKVPLKEIIFKQIKMKSFDFDYNKYIKTIIKEIIDDEENEHQKSYMNLLLEEFH